jgi:octanoyl-[GcvH]:protein N-octanoyltransferase
MVATFLVSDTERRSPVDDIQVSRDLLAAVGSLPVPVRLIRIYRPRPTVAMTARERHLPGFADACAASRDRGFTPVVRLTGGRAVAYDETSLVVEIYDSEIPGERKPDHREVFATIGEAFASALVTTGIDARVGAVPGEYCPGDFSVNARGRVKLVGTAQRVTRGARLVGASLALGQTDRLRDVLTEVNGHLDLDWDPATLAGAGTESGTFSEAAFLDALIAVLAPEGTQPVGLAAILADPELLRSLTPAGPQAL